MASFDPSQSSILLRTRYASAENAPADATIQWEVAESNSFQPVLKSGGAVVSSTTDYMLGMDATCLAANRKYYYRFRNERISATSVVGETRILPASG